MNEDLSILNNISMLKGLKNEGMNDEGSTYIENDKIASKNRSGRKNNNKI